MYSEKVKSFLGTLLSVIVTQTYFELCIWNTIIFIVKTLKCIEISSVRVDLLPIVPKLSELIVYNVL